MNKLIRTLFKPYLGLPREIYILAISRVVNAMGCFVGPLFTLILTSKIGLSSDKAGFYISAASILYMPAGIIGGKLTDIVGRKKMIVIFDSLAIAAYAACGFMEPSINMMYMVIVAATFMNMAGPAHDALVADVTKPENRDGSYALLYMGWNLGFAVGPILAGLLFEKHLNLLFIGDALTALLAMSLVIIFIKDKFKRNSKDVVLDQSRINERSEEGSIFSVLLKRPVLVLFTMIAIWYNFSYSQWSFMLPMQTDQYFANGAKYYTWLAAFNGVVVIFFTPLVTRFSINLNNIRKMVIGGLLYAVGFGMLGLIAQLPLFFISVFVFTIGEIILSISISPFIANNTPVSHRGRMNSVLMMTLGLGHTMGPMVMGKIITYTGIAKGWLIIGIILSIATVLMFMLEKFNIRRNALLAKAAAHN